LLRIHLNRVRKLSVEQAQRYFPTVKRGHKYLPPSQTPNPDSLARQMNALADSSLNLLARLSEFPELAEDSSTAEDAENSVEQFAVDLKVSSLSLVKTDS
jgi:hypothetical protein